MKTILKFSIINLLIAIASACNNPYNGKTVLATGNWNSIAPWSFTDLSGKMNFDKDNCVFKLSIGGLPPMSSFQWKVFIDKIGWMGCADSFDKNKNCGLQTNDQGFIRLVFDPIKNQLRTEIFSIKEPEIWVPCINKFIGSKVYAVGNWINPVWDVSNLNGLMEFNSTICSYTKEINGLIPNNLYKWKVVLNNTWSVNYGLNGVFDGKDASFNPARGDVRLIFTINPINLIYDYFVKQPVITTTTKSTATSTTSATTALSTTTSMLESTTTLDSKTTTTSMLASTTTSDSKTTTTTTAKGTETTSTGTTPLKITTTTTNEDICQATTKPFVEATGDWLSAFDLENWSLNNTIGAMTFLDEDCSYALIIDSGLGYVKSYQWKVVMSNIDYGCNGKNCTFKSNKAGAVRLLFRLNDFKLEYDENISECGDEMCVTGETCSYCPEDCGVCRPPECGDGFCEEFEDCPVDCSYN